MIHVDAVRRRAANYSERGSSSFPDRVTQAIDEVRRRYFQSLGTMYEGYFLLSVTYLPPLLAERKFVELMFDDDANTDTLDENARTKNLIDFFKRECNTIESRLSALKLQRLTSADSVLACIQLDCTRRIRNPRKDALFFDALCQYSRLL